MYPKKRFIQTALITTSLFVTTSALAENSLMASISYDLGGEQISNVKLEDGDSKKVKANQGISFAAGFRIQPSKNSEIQTTIGWKSGGAFASNGNVSWSSLPVEGTFLTKINKLLIGGGISYFLNPKQDADDAGKGYASNIDYDNALGYHVKLSYEPEATSYRIGAKYTMVDFDPEKKGKTVDGNSFGIFAEYVF
jgi:hypothetical protein